MNIFKIIVNNYKCLKDFVLEVNLNNKRGVNPLVLVGLNGTGKSSLLEVLSLLFNEHYLYSKKNFLLVPTLLDSKVECEYKLNSTDEKNKKLDVGASNIKELPEFIVAYSSGLNNQTLANQYQNLTKEYYDNLKISTQKNELNQKIEQRKGIFIEYELNWLLFISLYIFNKEDLLDLFEHIPELNIKKIDSFLIKWKNPKWLNGYSNRLPYEMAEFLAILPKVSLEHPTKTDDKGVIYKIKNVSDIRDYLETYLGISTSIELFKVLESFYLLNEKENESCFEILDLKVINKQIKEPIHYKDLSDGQHQLIHILGILLMFKDTNSIIMLDEPDTHLNPSLRSNFISLVNIVMNPNGEYIDENAKHPQIIISTHSPFIIGDTPKENIRHFKIKDGKAVAEEIDWQTYGASYSLILSKIFGLPSGISEFAEKQIQELIDSNDIEEINRSIDDFGKSIKLRELYSKLEKLEEKNVN